MKKDGEQVPAQRKKGAAACQLDRLEHAGAGCIGGLKNGWPFKRQGPNKVGAGPPTALAVGGGAGCVWGGWGGGKESCRMQARVAVELKWGKEVVTERGSTVPLGAVAARLH